VSFRRLFGEASSSEDLLVADMVENSTVVAGNRSFKENESNTAVMVVEGLIVRCRHVDVSRS
jgi:hypothetical protein